MIDYEALVFATASATVALGALWFSPRATQPRNAPHTSHDALSWRISQPFPPAAIRPLLVVLALPFLPRHVPAGEAIAASLVAVPALAAGWALLERLRPQFLTLRADALGVRVFGGRDRIAFEARWRELSPVQQTGQDLRFERAGQRFRLRAPGAPPAQLREVAAWLEEARIARAALPEPGLDGLPRELAAIVERAGS